MDSGNLHDGRIWCPAVGVTTTAVLMCCHCKVSVAIVDCCTRCPAGSCSSVPLIQTHAVTVILTWTFQPCHYSKLHTHVVLFTSVESKPAVSATVVGACSTSGPETCPVTPQVSQAAPGRPYTLQSGRDLAKCSRQHPQQQPKPATGVVTRAASGSSVPDCRASLPTSQVAA